MSRLDRQSFLGPDSDLVLASATIGVVGLGGGGSHVVQQAAHMGIGGYVNVDPQTIQDTNTNRLVGGTLADVDAELPKTDIAERLIRGLQPHARFISVRDSWHTGTDHLKTADVIIGAVDSFKEREQLERFARRYLIPYIDIGMDVHDLGKEFLVSGQVILSTPGAPCLRCCGFITDDRLKQEANRYGARRRASAGRVVEWRPCLYGDRVVDSNSHALVSKTGRFRIPGVRRQQRYSDAQRAYGSPQGVHLPSGSVRRRNPSRPSCS